MAARARYALIGGLTLLTLGALGAGAWLVTSHVDLQDWLRASQKAPTTGSVAEAVEQGMAARQAATADLVELEEVPAYEAPRAVYLAEGFDPDHTELGFDGGAPEERTGNLPRMLTRGQIQAVIAENQSELLRCYADELQEDPDLTGKVDFDFAIRGDGTVAMVKVTGSTLQSYGAEDCFVERARHWRFPETGQSIPARFTTDMTFQY